MKRLSPTSSYKIIMVSLLQIIRSTVLSGRIVVCLSWGNEKRQIAQNPQYVQKIVLARVVGLPTSAKREKAKGETFDYYYYRMAFLYYPISTWNQRRNHHL